MAPFDSKVDTSHVSTFLLLEAEAAPVSTGVLERGATVGTIDGVVERCGCKVEPPPKASQNESLEEYCASASAFFCNASCSFKRARSDSDKLLSFFDELKDTSVENASLEAGFGVVDLDIVCGVFDLKGLDVLDIEDADGIEDGLNAVVEDAG